MPQEPRPLDPNLSARDRFGAALRRWRQLRRLSQAQVGEIVPVSRDQIAKYEKADRWPNRKTAERLDNFLGAGGELVVLWADGDAERNATHQRKVIAAADPTYVAHWTRMLAVLATTGNAVGGRGLLDVVSTEVSIISNHGAATTGSLAAAYLGIQARWLEFGSWIADNQGDPVKATAWLKLAGELARRADDAVLCAYVLMRRSQRALEGGQPRLALDLLANTQMSVQPPRTRALLAIRAAHACASMDDGSASRSFMKQARGDASGDIDSDTADLEIASHATPDYLRAYEGVCLLALSEPNGAVRVLEDVLDRWPASQRLDEGLFRAYLAEAYIASGANDEGVLQAHHALDLGLETGSRRTLRIVRQVVERKLDGVAGYQDLVDQWTIARGQGGK